METTNVTLRMEKGLKESADELFGNLGLSFSSAVNLFVRKALRTQSIPFDVSMSSTNARTIETVRLLDSLLSSPEAQQRIANIGSGTLPTYHSTSSLEEAHALIAAISNNDSSAD